MFVRGEIESEMLSQIQVDRQQMGDSWQITKVCSAACSVASINPMHSASSYRTDRNVWDDADLFQFRHSEDAYLSNLTWDRKLPGYSVLHSCSSWSFIWDSILSIDLERTRRSKPFSNSYLSARSPTSTPRVRFGSSRLAWFTFGLTGSAASR